ncbi:hypothetical protein L3556_05160 [Candidatus Synechococcus calcipolaris G9]|uniref:Uncharacterized protein n=1 Tax=Candidatus Synechococcus calcipolaris G9 TaxID=1497997 RepID=A0ABT6EWZ3_9SYNE|nr:hypothetical protein [Candidatus Synechococcus calcipolaris]MDG2990327.1 hypothetical protein [Candidatus Synechococcus calcipolaris G9]
MNAAELACGLELTSKIAAIVNLVKRDYPDMRADLRPWADDPHTQNLVDPDSIDLGFHLPGWSRRWQARSLLVQVRLHGEEGGDRRAIGIEIVGFSYFGEQWRFSTVAGGVFTGQNCPIEEIRQQLRDTSGQILALLNPAIDP